MYDYKLHLVIRTPQACPWEQSGEEYEKQFNMKVDIKPVSELSYEEKIVDIQRVIPDVNLISREDLSDREIETIEKAK